MMMMMVGRVATIAGLSYHASLHPLCSPHLPTPATSLTNDHHDRYHDHHNDGDDHDDYDDHHIIYCTASNPTSNQSHHLGGYHDHDHD